MRQLALLMPGTLFLGVPVSVWDAIRIGAGLTDEEMTLAFYYIYWLEIATIEEGEPPSPIDVVRPTNLPLWVDWSLYVLTPASLCPDGCEQSRVLPP